MATDAQLVIPRPRETRQEFHRIVKQALEMAKQKDQTLATMRWFGERNLFFFAVYILHMTYLDNDWAYALCHHVQRQKYGRMWIISREHFKSTVITIASTIWEIVKDPETTIAIYSYNQTQAQKLFFAPIKKEFDENYLLQQLYPEVLWGDEKPGDTWLSDALNVKRKRRSKEYTLTCSSLFSQLTGSHYDKIIYDDCETIETVQTEDSIQAAKDAWDMSLNTGRADNLNICVIGTYYSYHELYEYITSKGIVETIVQPCVDPNGIGVLWSDEVILERKKSLGSATFATQCLCDPKAGSSIGFKKEWIKYWHAGTYAGLNIYIFVDPAGKVNRKRDNSVFWVIGLDSLDNFYVLDLIADKMNLTVRCQTLFHLHRTYQPRNIFYEQVGMQADIEHIQSEQERYNYRFPITPMNQTVDKGMRMENLIPYFEAGRIYLPEHCVHRNWQGQDEDMIATFIQEEYLAFPHMTHDDRLDDLANITREDIASQLTRPDRWSQEREIYEKMKKRGAVSLPFDEGGSNDNLMDYNPLEQLLAN